MLNKLIKTTLLILISSSFIYASPEDIHPSEIFTQRHSGKAYDPTQTVSREQILALIEAARWAPSSHNDQPWNFIICHKDLSPEAYEKAFSALKPSTQQQWAINAPLLIIVVAREHQLYDGKFNEWNEYDTGSSAMSMALQASDLGLMAHQIGGFDKQKISHLFHLPEHHKPMTIMVVGYESTKEDPAAQPRLRRPIGENFFLGTWNVPFAPPESDD